MQNPEESLQTPETGPNEKPEITSVESTEAAAPIVEETIESPAIEEIQEVVEASIPEEISEEILAAAEVIEPLESAVSDESVEEVKTPEVTGKTSDSASSNSATEVEITEEDHEHDERARAHDGAQAVGHPAQEPGPRPSFRGGRRHQQRFMPNTRLDPRGKEGTSGTISQKSVPEYPYY